MPVPSGQLANRNPGAAKRAAAALTRDPGRVNRLIAIEASCDERTVQKTRKRLEAANSIPVIAGPGSWKPWTPQKAAAELRANPCRSDQLIAGAAGVSPQTVRATRARLVGLFQIGDVPVHRRERRPVPQQPSRTRELLQAHPDWSPARVARAAGVSVQAVYVMIRRTRPLGDLAAAVDTLRVLKIIPVPCEHCRTPFPWAGGPRYCSPACTAAAQRERTSRNQRARGLKRPALADPDHPPPRVRELPRPPDWSRGLCTTVPSRMRTWWSSEIRPEREAARLMCQGCPVLGECETWSLSFPLDDATIYAGMSAAERRRRARALRDEIIRQVTSTRPNRR
jgi:Transcription factor WhiB